MSARDACCLCRAREARARVGVGDRIRASFFRMDRRDRGHFAAAARAFAVDEELRIREALDLPIEERIRIGLRMGQATPTDAAIEAELDRRALGQAALHRRWRTLHGSK